MMILTMSSIAQAGPAIGAPMGNPLMLPAAPTGMSMASSPSFGGM